MGHRRCSPVHGCCWYLPLFWSSCWCASILLAMGFVMRSIPVTDKGVGEAARPGAARGPHAADGLPEAGGDEGVLTLDNLDVTFSTPDGEVAAVRDFSLTIARGECVGIVGESGAGKSQAFLAPM